MVEEGPADAGPAPDAPDAVVAEDIGPVAQDVPTVVEDAAPLPEPEPDPLAGPIPNEGWIGAPCNDDSDCDYPEAEGGFCLAGEDGWPGGTCSLSCDRLCPDRAGNQYTITFCVDGEDGGGACVSRCGYDLFESGCREGYTCAELPRHTEPATQRLACLPSDRIDGEGHEPGECIQELLRMGLHIEPAEDRNDHPEGREDLTCRVADPVRVTSPVLGADYRYFYYERPSRMYMACELAQALAKLAELLAEHDVVEVVHVGTYNCRTLRGGASLSQHATGTAIDIAGVKLADGTEYTVLDDWETLYGEPVLPGGILLHDLAWAMHSEGIFNVVLTPDYNEAHANHFHVDLTPGSQFLGKKNGIPAPTIGTFDEAGYLD